MLDVSDINIHEEDTELLTNSLKGCSSLERIILPDHYSLESSLEHLILQKERTSILPSLTADFANLGMSVSVHQQSSLDPAELKPVELIASSFLPITPFLLPADTEAVSPAYLLRAETDLPIQFTVRIQHCVSLQSEEDCRTMKFLSASPSTQIKRSSPVYKFGGMEGTTGIFRAGDTVGEVVIKELGLFVVARSGKQRGKYTISAHLHIHTVWDILHEC